MKSSTLGKLLSRGITPQHPAFLEEARKLEKRDAAEQQAQRKAALLRGWKLVAQHSSNADILRWLQAEPAIRIGPISHLEIWQQGAQYRLAALHPATGGWSVYRILSHDGKFHLRGRVL